MRKCLWGGCLFCLAAMPSMAQQIDDVVVFGDSLSDPGNIPGLSGGVNFPPSPPYVDNRFSNGPVYSESLPGLLGKRFDPSLNFAVGGALTGTENLNSNRANPDPGSDLTDIVLPGIETQVSGFLSGGGRLDSDDLVIVYGGANDVFVAAETAATLPTDEIPTLIQSTAAKAAGNIAESVAKLNAAGGEVFILPNLPDIGTTPSFAAGGADSIALGSGFTTAHNLALDQAAANLQIQTGANIIVFDVEGIVKDIQANPALYGVSNTTDACIETPACVTGDVDTQNQFLFFDGVHPTAGIHDKFAQILATSVRAPTTLAAQGDVTLIAGEAFQRTIFDHARPTSGTISVGTASGSKATVSLDTTDLSGDDVHKGRSTDLFVAAGLTEGDRDERTGALGYDYDLGTLTVGLRHELNPRLLLGGAMGIGTGEVDIDGGSESFDHRQVQVGMSATYLSSGSYITGLANLGYAKIRDIERRTGIEGVETSGNTDGFIYGLGLAGGHLFSLGEGIHLGPVGSLRYSAVDLDGYVEDGPAFANQKVEEQKDIDSLVLSLGATLEADWKVSKTHDLKLRLIALAEHDFEDDDRTIESSFVTSPTTLRTRVQAGDQTKGRLGADIDFGVTRGISVGLGYETVVGFDDGSEHSITARANLRF